MREWSEVVWRIARPDLKRGLSALGGRDLLPCVCRRLDRRDRTRQTNDTHCDLTIEVETTLNPNHLSSSFNFLNDQPAAGTGRPNPLSSLCTL